MPTVQDLQTLAAAARAHPCDASFAALVAATDQFNADAARRDPENYMPIFVCPLCGGCFYVDPAHTQADKLRDYERDIPEHLRDGSRATVCSTCYTNVLGWMEKKGLSPL